MHTTTIRILALLGILLVLNNAYSQQLDKLVFKVISQAGKGEKLLVGTGFLYKSGNITGIVTSLHLVVGGSRINAYYPGQAYTDLKIKLIDVENDIALLYSDALPSAGLTTGKQILTPGKKMKVLGYPDDMIGINQKTVNIGNPSTTKLVNILPGYNKEAFFLRKSPHPENEIFYVEGNMIPGHSGAPLLDESNQVYGVICGGIREGAAAITWAIPIKNIKFQNPKNPEMAKRLSALIVTVKKLQNLFEVEIRSNENEEETTSEEDFDLSGTWAMTMSNSYAILSDNTPQTGHYRIRGEFNLSRQNNHVITGKFSSGASIDCSKGDVIGSINGKNIELRITCTKGRCLGSGFIIKGQIVGEAIIGKDEAMADRPAPCKIWISKEISLERR